ncbi:MAG TPA: phosphatase PAP2 family protein [Amycolatopsis sp.]|nr:phosphatase PAP2 family protein [Amycolatopsis sp.]
MPIVAALVVAVLGTIYFAGGTLGPFDGRAEGWDALREPWRTIALTVDFCGEPLGSTILTGIVVAVCLLLRRARLAVTAVAGIGVTIAATTALKPIVGRTIHGDYLSFPSGHTAFASALALIVALTVIDVFHPGHHGRSLTIAALVLPAGAAMGWAQVMLSAHYPTDTLGGFCTALATVPATAHLVDRAWKPRG